MRFKSESQRKAAFANMNGSSGIKKGQINTNKEPMIPTEKVKDPLTGADVFSHGISEKPKLKAIYDDPEYHSFYKIEGSKTVPEIHDRKVPSHLYINITNMKEAVGSDWKEDEDYHGEIMLVPDMSEFSRKAINDVVSSSGMTIQEMKNADRFIADAVDYGFGIRMGEGELGKDPEKLAMKLAEEARSIPVMIGFYLDRPVNRMGETGWDWLGKMIE